MCPTINNKPGLLVATLVCALTAPHSMASDTEWDIYGQARLHLNYLDDGADYSAASVSTNASVLGFRGKHVFSPELRGIIQVEGQINLTNNQSANERFTFRDSLVGLDSDWGLVRVGRYDTPLKLLRTRTDLFGNQIGDARGITRNNTQLSGGGRAQGFDERLSSAVGYRSPALNGVFLDFAYSPESRDADGFAEDNNPNDAVSASLTYQAGPLYAAIAHERYGRNQADSDLERDATRVSAYADLGAFRITGHAQTLSDPDDETYGVGVRYKATDKVFLKTQFYTLNGSGNNRDADMLAVGAEYRYVSNLTFHLNYAQVNNDNEQSIDPWSQGSSLRSTTAAGETNRVVATGVRYQF